MLKVGIWVESFRCAGILIFSVARWIFCASTTFEILALSTCTECREKSYISKGIQAIFEIFASARRCWEWGIWVESFRCAGFLLLQRQAENFAHRHHLKFPTFNLFTVTAKILYLQRYSNDFRKLCFSSKKLKVGMWESKVSGAQVFYFCNGEAKTLRIDNIWNFATFNLYSVPAKILYLQRYSTYFRNLCLSTTMLRVGIWVESFSCAGILLLQWQGENIAHRQHLKVLPLSTCTVCQQKSYILHRCSTDFRIRSPQLEDVEGGHLGGKCQLRRYSSFAMARWKLCASTTFEILPLSTCAVCQQKSCISKGIEPIFENFDSARRCWRWAFEWKVSGAQVF